MSIAKPVHLLGARVAAHRNPRSLHHVMSGEDAGQEAEVLLVAVDDSEGSDRAFEFAVRHLHRPGTELHLVHIVPRLHFAAA